MALAVRLAQVARDRAIIAEREVTERRRAEEALQTLNETLEQRIAERTHELEAEVAERRKAERELRKLFRSVEQSPSMVFITDTEGVIEYINPRFTEMTGYTGEEAIGQNPRILKSGETPRDVYVDMWRTIKAGDEWRGELKDRRKDGHLYWADVSIAPVRNQAGAITHFVAMHEDISERKAAEEAVRNAMEKAEIANRAKTELLANMSHELRTPLNAIIGFSNSLSEGLFGPLANAKQAEYILDIHASGQHLLDLINDILDVSAIEAGKMELHEELIDIEKIANATMRLIQSRASDGSIALKLETESPLPALFGDARRIKQVFLNLLSNAVKFTLEGGRVDLTIRLREDRAMCITVADTGIGMDADGIAKAMMPFGQVDGSLARKHEGTGLGLPLTRGLVECHDGALDIVSALGSGTTVTVTLPASRVSQGLSPDEGAWRGEQTKRAAPAGRPLPDQSSRITRKARPSRPSGS